MQVNLDDAERALMAEAVSPFGARVLELDLSLEMGVLVCGDRWGNIAAFSMPAEALSRSGGVPLPLQVLLVHCCIVQPHWCSISSFTLAWMH